MSDDRTIPPSPARVRLAWEAGIRPNGRWLPIGVLALLGAAVIAAADLGDVGGSILAVEPSAPADPMRALSSWLVGTLAITVTVVAVIVVTAIATGGFGAISTHARRRLAAEPVRPGAAVLLVVGAIAAIGSALILAGVIAAGARAVAASPAGLAQLWQAWAVRGLSVVGAVIIVAGIVEHVWIAFAQRRALMQTVAEARADRRAAGNR